MQSAQVPLHPSENNNKRKISRCTPGYLFLKEKFKSKDNYLQPK